MKGPVALIAGPTASGKSGLAIELALALENAGIAARIINADSAQVYADLQILSARPDAEEMRGIDHRLFGAWDGAQACSAADWAARAKQEISSAHAQGAVPILVGGTGMYLQVLLEGIAPIPEIDPSVRAEIRAMNVAQAYGALEALDPERADILNPADSQRIARALEVVRSTGRTLGDWQSAKTGGIEPEILLHPLIMLPDRDWLYDRCDHRFVHMIEQGALDEVTKLLERGLGPGLPVMRAIGVSSIADFLHGELTREEMIMAGQQATRNYAKRQFTWFRNQPSANWPRLESQKYELSDIFASLLLN